MTTLSNIKAKIVEAIPDKSCPLEADGKHCPFHTIGLADVFRAIEKSNKTNAHLYSVDMYGGIRRENQHLNIHWNLSASLDDQSEEVLTFLAKVLGL